LTPALWHLAKIKQKNKQHMAVHGMYKAFHMSVLGANISLGQQSDQSMTINKDD